MIEKMLFAIVLVMVGLREITIQLRGLKRIELNGPTQQYEQPKRYINLIWGGSLTILGIGTFWSPLASLAWVVAGLSRIAVIPTPCNTEIFNHNLGLRILRALFFTSFGLTCIAFGLGFII